MLVYFVTFRRERIPAKQVFDAIWAEKGGRGLTAFHTALSRLRSVLRMSETTPRLILIETGNYRLDAARFRIDLDEFDTALAKARAAANENAAAEWYEQALNLYRGEYLQNLYYDWLMPERRRLTQAYLASLRALAEHHYAHDALRAPCGWTACRKICTARPCVFISPWVTAQGLVRQYQELKEVLWSELEMEPMETTDRLYQRLMESY